MVLVVSTDNGALYLPEHVDDPNDTEHWWKLRVPDTGVTLTPEQLTGHDGAIAEILLNAGVAQKVS